MVSAYPMIVRRLQQSTISLEQHEQTVVALRQFGIWSRKLDTDLSHAALRSSYAIYLCRNDPVWSWDVAINGVSDDAAPSLKE